MPYTPTNWQDRISGSPGQFSATGSVPGNITLTLNDNPSQNGTAVNADRMNNIENELVSLDAFMNKRISCSETKITSTSATNILAYTPSTQGNFEIKAYLRVVTAPTTVTVTATYTDASGAQTVALVPTQKVLIGSGMIPMYFLNSVANQPITLTITAGTANQVYVSSTIEGM
jgi:hypothetical protein